MKITGVRSDYFKSTKHNAQGPEPCDSSRDSNGRIIFRDRYRVYVCRNVWICCRFLYGSPNWSEPSVTAGRFFCYTIMKNKGARIATVFAPFD